MGAAAAMHKSTATPRCLMEARGSIKRRRRPPTFGSTVPTIAARGLSTTTTDGAGDVTLPTNIEDREDCPLCKKFGKGPCGETFKRWLACTDKHPGKDANGEPFHLAKCTDLAENLGWCLDANSDYYANDENNKEDEDDGSKKNNEPELKVAWRGFVDQVEGGIASGEHTILPFPEEIEPEMQVSLATDAGACFFAREKDGHPLMAAYVLDEKGNVVAAGSKEDMDMGAELGCVLQFKTAGGIESATARAVYDTESNDIAVFTRTMMVPQSKG